MYCMLGLLLTIPLFLFRSLVVCRVGHSRVVRQELYVRDPVLIWAQSEWALRIFNLWRG